MVSGKLAGWLNVAFGHATVLWHVWQSVEKPALAWFGLVVAWYCGRWQLTHEVERPVYTPGVVWHALQACAECPLVSGKLAGWMKFAPCQPAVLWQVLQLVEKPAAAWFGLVVAWKSGRWQLTQSVERPVNTPGVVWHSLQLTLPWPAVSGKLAGCTNEAGVQDTGVWQRLQPCVSPRAT